MTNGEDWDNIRRRVYRRDNHTCQRCGAKGGKEGDRRVVAHHVIPKSEGGGDGLDNLITLCHRCHARVHPENAKLSPASQPASDIADKAREMYKDYDLLLPVHIFENHYGVLAHRTQGETTVNVWHVDFAELTCDCPEKTAGAEVCIHYVKAFDVHPTSLYADREWTLHRYLPLQGECWAPVCIIDFLENPEDITPYPKNIENALLTLIDGR